MMCSAPKAESMQGLRIDSEEGAQPHERLGAFGTLLVTMMAKCICAARKKMAMDEKTND